MHFMIDTETLSTASNAVLLQIGIQAFDPMEDELKYEGIKIQVNPQDCIDLGLRIDWSTILFWLQQNDDARASVCAADNVPLAQALRDLTTYIERFSSGLHLVKVWGNGAAFDIPILENAFRAVGLAVPWAYNGVLDVRTLKWLAPDAPRPVPLTEHDALSDAQAQARWVQNMYKKLKGNTPLGLLWDKLSRHDWTYMMSDDGRVASEGAAKDAKLLAEAKALGEEGAKLYDDFYKYVWNQGATPDRPWGV